MIQFARELADRYAEQPFGAISFNGVADALAGDDSKAGSVAKTACLSRVLTKENNGAITDDFGTIVVNLAKLPAFSQPHCLPGWDT